MEKELEAIPASKSAIAAVRCARAALLLSSLRSSPRSLRTVSPDAPPRDTEDLLKRGKLRRSVADLRTRSDLFGWVEVILLLGLMVLLTVLVWVLVFHRIALV
ncbi:hypothetical protein MUK42_37466 [Musa troglodytarum]|uniref:Uncharacterized protein n=1 Tax=Musa troglodytarum TaxID=320322 RepID=A0A9E7HZS2_9LILI|nr:hypothetical protein MUK42_37466 [Musa troglodytarum]